MAEGTGEALVDVGVAVRAGTDFVMGTDCVVDGVELAISLFRADSERCGCWWDDEEAASDCGEADSRACAMDFCIAAMRFARICVR